MSGQSSGPDRPICNFRASKSGDQLNVYTSGDLIDLKLPSSKGRSGVCVFVLVSRSRKLCQVDRRLPPMNSSGFPENSSVMKGIFFSF